MVEKVALHVAAVEEVVKLVEIALKILFIEAMCAIAVWRIRDICGKASGASLGPTRQVSLPAVVSVPSVQL